MATKTRTRTNQLDIRAAAEELLAAANISRPPVDLVQVARLQGIEKIRHRKMRQTLGTLREGRDGLTVTLNRREPFRERFTLAHEIAHTIVDPPDSGAATVALAQRTSARDDDVERLCDEIAVELLLPYEMFRSALGDDDVSIGAIFGLAKQFDASLQSTALRAGELSSRPVEVVCWKRAGSDGVGVKARRGKEYLTVAHADERTLGDESPVARAFRSKQIERGKELPARDAPWNVYDCEARGFLRGASRFVISVARPLAAEPS